MKKLFFGTMLVLGAIFVSSPDVNAYSYQVDGYYRSNGTYVQPHYRTSPDSTVYNNYSTKGNYNPYTGNYGTRNPYGSTYRSRSYNSYGGY
jgi:hypothetical protein